MRYPILPTILRCSKRHFDRSTLFERALLPLRRAHFAALLLITVFLALCPFSVYAANITVKGTTCTLPCSSPQAPIHSPPPPLTLIRRL
jgi:hypothetical protein